MALEEETPQTFSFPSLIIVAGLGYLLYRYFFASPSSTGTSTTPRNGLRFTAAQVDHISSMFPQLSRRDIMWDLQRNGGSVQATTERILGGRGLEVAPPSFQPNLPPTPGSTAAVAQALPSKPKVTEPDLITRYNLQSRLQSSDKGKQKEEEPVQYNEGMGKSSTLDISSKESRQSSLLKRRDEMILAARRRMMEKEAAGGSAAS